MTHGDDWAACLRLAVEVVTVCRRAGVTVATCESLTGGMVTTALTAVPGASAVVRGGLVTYATELKAVLAGVEESTLRAGVVSEATALAMASGARTRCGADVGLATTGVAGPGPADGVPAGTVWIAVVAAGRSKARMLRLDGSRECIREGTVAAVLDDLMSLLGHSFRTFL